MFFALKLDADVINDEDKKDRTPLMAPQAGCDEALVGAMFHEAFGEQVVGELPSLFEAVEPLLISKYTHP
jgi:hypothetical protein